jgi:hypothetical protein
MATARFNAAGPAAMQLPITATNPLNAPATQASGRGLPWRAGAVLQAVVLDASAPGRVELQIGGHTVSARTLFALAEGQVLSLRVAHSGELVILEQEGEPGAQTGPRPSDSAQAQQALREALPRQAPLPPLLANLLLVAREPARFAPQLVDAARAALQALPDARALADAETLAGRVERSGLWLETALAAAAARPHAPPAALASDWKAVLLRLGASLRLIAAPPAQAPVVASTAAHDAPAYATQAPRADTPAPFRAGSPQPQARAEAALAQLPPVAADDAAGVARQLLKQVEGALARVELGQLASLPGDDAQPQRWWLELPVRGPDGGADVFQMRIEREPAGARAGEEEVVWAVSLAFDLGDLGPVRARIAVRGEGVSTLFYAEREATVARLRAQLGGLEAALAGRGLAVGSIGCRAGEPGGGSDDAGGEPLVEVHA